MVGGGGKMAELMLLSEIADPTRFFTDNLLSPEDWGARSEARGEGAGCSRRGGPRRAGRPQRVGEEGWSDAEPSVCGRRSGALAFPGCGRKRGAAPRSGDRGWAPWGVWLSEWAGGGSGPAEPMGNGAGADTRAGLLADSTLYSGLDEVAEEQTQLFRCLEQDVPVLLPRRFSCKPWWWEGHPKLGVFPEPELTLLLLDPNNARRKSSFNIV